MPRVEGQIDWNRLCGRITLDGSRCMRPKGCRLRHRGPRAEPAKQAVNLALSLSEPTPLLGRSPAPLTDRQFGAYPRGSPMRRSSLSAQPMAWNPSWTVTTPSGY